MAREYTITGPNTTAGAITLIGILSSATVGFEILRVWCGQAANTTSAQQRIQLVSQASVYPNMGTVTPQKTKLNDPASAFTGAASAILTAGKCGITATAEGAGTKLVIWEDCFNVLNGWLWVATPKETLEFPAGCVQSFGLYMPVAPGTTTGWSFGCVFAEH